MNWTPNRPARATARPAPMLRALGALLAGAAALALSPAARAWERRPWP